MSTSQKVIVLLIAAGWVLQCLTIELIWTAPSVPFMALGAMLLVCVALAGAIFCVREAKPTWAGATLLVLLAAIFLQWYAGEQINSVSRTTQNSLEQEDAR